MRRPVTRRLARRKWLVYKETLRSLALSDEGFVESVLGMGHDTVEVSGLDQRTHALVRLGAALAVDAAPSSYQSTIDVALAAGASIDEIVGTLIAVAPTVGLARVVSAAPELALALGYDLETAFETPDGPSNDVQDRRTCAPPGGSTQPTAAGRAPQESTEVRDAPCANGRGRSQWTHPEAFRDPHHQTTTRELDDVDRDGSTPPNSAADVDAGRPRPGGGDR